MTSFSEKYATFYDGLYSGKDYGAECRFLLEIIHRYISSPRPLKLLDFGCGTGRHAVLFSSLGLEVEGYDKSVSMLEVAERRARAERCSAIFHRNIPEGPFSVVVSLFAVLNYLASASELTEVLKTLAGRLVNDGLLLAEMWNGSCVPQCFQQNRETKFLFEGQSWVRSSLSNLDWLKQRMRVEFTFAREGKTEAAFSEMHTLCYYTPQQMGGILHMAGLELVEIYPAYEAREPRANDFNLVFICRRKRQ